MSCPTSTSLPSSVVFGVSCTPHILHIQDASTAWKLIMQAGGYIKAPTALSVYDFLLTACNLLPTQLEPIDVFFLNGKPVDSPKQTLITGGSRLALAAGLPGIAGLAMKANSPVKALRPGITHTDEKCPSVATQTDSIEVALYSLALSSLAEHFLAQKISFSVQTILRYSRYATDSPCSLDGQPISLTKCIDIFASLPFDTQIVCSACFAK